MHRLPNRVEISSAHEFIERLKHSSLRCALPAEDLLKNEDDYEGDESIAFLNLVEPMWVQEQLYRSKSLGAQVLITPTREASLSTLKSFGLEKHFKAINYAALQLSQELKPQHLVVGLADYSDYEQLSYFVELSAAYLLDNSGLQKDEELYASYQARRLALGLDLDKVAELSFDAYLFEGFDSVSQALEMLKTLDQMEEKFLGGRPDLMGATPARILLFNEKVLSVDGEDERCKHELSQLAQASDLIALEGSDVQQLICKVKKLSDKLDLHLSRHGCKLQFGAFLNCAALGLESLTPQSPALLKQQEHLCEQRIVLFAQKVAQEHLALVGLRNARPAQLALLL